MAFASMVGLVIFALGAWWAVTAPTLVKLIALGLFVSGILIAGGRSGGWSGG